MTPRIGVLPKSATKPLITIVTILALIAGILGGGAVVVVVTSLFNVGGSAEAQAQAAAKAPPESCTTADPVAVSLKNTKKLPTSVPELYRNLFTRTADTVGVDVFALATVFWLENHQTYPEPPAPDGNGQAWQSSGRGAAGAFQRTPTVWKTYGVDANHDGKADVNNLTEATDGAALQLKDSGATPAEKLGDLKNLTIHGTLVNALASFTAGTGGDFTTRQVIAYVTAGLKYYGELTLASNLGFDLSGNAGDPSNPDFIANEIAQTMIVGFDASTPQAVVLGAVKTYHLGGIFITGQDEQVATTFTPTFIARLKAPDVGGPHFTVASDEEGGQIKNFAYNFDYPSAEAMGQAGTTAVTAIGTKVARQLKIDGVTMALGPVLDISSGRTSLSGTTKDVISGYGRSFGTTPAQVVTSAGTWAKAVQAGGITVVFKHYPGLGRGTGELGNDSDHAVVTSPDAKTLKGVDRIPYEQLFAGNPKAVVMLSNERVQGADPTRPATLSDLVVTMLRTQDKFTGVITTDDLNVVPVVTAAGGSIENAVIQAYFAGVTMPLFSIGATDGPTVTSKLKSIIDGVKLRLPPATIAADLNLIGSIKPGLIIQGTAPVVDKNPAATTPTPVSSSTAQFGFNPVAPTSTAAPVVTPVTPSQVPLSSTVASAPATGGATPTGPPNGNFLNTKDNAEVAYNFLMKQVLPDGRKLTPAKASGIVGNMIKESGVEPQRLQSVFSRLVPAKDIEANLVGGTGWGIVQETPYSKMTQPLLGAGKDPNDILVQLNFLWEQLTGTGLGKVIAETGAMDQLMSNVGVNDTPENASYAFSAGYERFFTPGNQTSEQQQSINDRESAAREIYNNAMTGAPLSADLKAEIATTAVSKLGAIGTETAVQSTAPSTPPVCALAVDVLANNPLPISRPTGTGGKGCTSGPAVLPVPAGGKGTAVCAFQQGEQSSSSYEWGKCGCLPTSTLIIQATMENNPKLDPNLVQAGVQGHGGLDQDGCSGVYTGALSYLKSLGYTINTIDAHPSDGAHHKVTLADLAAVVNALSQGYLILTHTSPNNNAGQGSVSSAGVDSEGNGTTDGHYLVIRAVDAQGNFYVANPGARSDNDAVISPARIMAWLDMFYAVKKP